MLIYARNKETWRPNLLGRTEEANGSYSNPDNDPRGVWQSLPLQAKSGSDPNFIHIFENGISWSPPVGRFSAFSHDSLKEMEMDNRIWFGKNGKNTPRYKKFLSEVKDGLVPVTLWTRDETGDNQEAKKEAKQFNPKDVFDTPKPEKLLERIIHLATNPGDLVLDSFAGSGTTGAVAHKMGRRWIMVELGEHCHTHIIPRLRKVIDGTDQGGISKAVNWQGGGGFRYYRLAPTLIVHDRWGNDIINPDYNPEMLAEAMAKLEGFTYQPSPTLWWQHGHSSENDYLYVTTQTLSAAQLQALAEEVGPGRSLLICCSAWRGITLQEAAERFPNLTLKKIPKMVRERCEWGHDDYSLNVANLPLAEADQPPQEPGSKQGGLFDDGEHDDA